MITDTYSLAVKVDNTATKGLITLAIAVTVAALGLGACGGSNGPGNPDSRLSEEQATAPLEGAPAPLASIRSEANRLLDGGTDAFERRIAELRGFPVVVNKWASWCGPCRFEFPFFQSQVKKRGTRIAFLAVDSEDAREEARDFLEEFPVPYPSFFDPRNEIAKLLELERNFPTTTFYDAAGELVYTKPGGYASEAALEDDIREYSVEGARAGQ